MTKVKESILGLKVLSDEALVCPYIHTDNCKNVYRGRENRSCNTIRHTECVDYKTIKFGEVHN